MHSGVVDMRVRPKLACALRSVADLTRSPASARFTQEIYTKMLLCLRQASMQVVRARLQQRQAHNRAVQYRDGLATFKLILQREGAGGLYKGLVPNVLRVMPQSAITFLVYEKVMQLLEADVFRSLEQSWGQ